MKKKIVKKVSWSLQKVIWFSKNLNTYLSIVISFNQQTKIFNSYFLIWKAYRIYGTKVQAVKRKLDELIEEKFSSDSKLDSMDMEMSDDDLNEKENSRRKATPQPLMQATSSSSSNNSIRNNLDPRQNRHSNRKSPEPPPPPPTKAPESSKTKTPESNKRKSSGEESSDKHHKTESSSTPVHDENQGNNPLDFLTKFINKSASNTTSPAPPLPAASSKSTASNSSSANLSYIVSSLQKFVNTNPTPNSLMMPMSEPPPPPPPPPSTSNQNKSLNPMQQTFTATAQFFDPTHNFQGTIFFTSSWKKLQNLKFDII